LDAPPAVRTTNSGSPVTGRYSLSIDVAEIESLQRRLAYYVGPIAKHLVKRATATAADREELTQMLAAEVAPAPERKQFLEECRAAETGKHQSEF